MERTRLLPPSPEVQYLPAIFRRIQSGDIRIPAFQRDFVWNEAQILELLESVYRGFPIGSALLWKVESNVLKISDSSSIPFPSVDVKFPLNFVLDGMQRLSALYGVFHNDKTSNPGTFNVLFDMESETFIHYDEENLPSIYLRLADLFSPKRLLNAQRQLAEYPNSDIFLDKTIDLHSVFQEYLIPTVTISDRSVSEVVKIFERINSTGTRLSPFDFMRALTWSSAFDLNLEISNLQTDFSLIGFEIPSETLVKLLAIVLSVAPISDEMIKLRDFEPHTLAEGVKVVKEVVCRVIEFLKKNFLILSYSYVPYEGQFLVLFKLFFSQENPNEISINRIENWFWSISFSEGLRGKPDHYVARYLNNVESLVSGNYESLMHRFSLSMEDLIDRRFVKGKALSAAVSSMFAKRKARSLFTGEIIDYFYYMSEFSSENFESIYSIDEVASALQKEKIISARIFANIIVVEQAERKKLSLDSVGKIIEELFEVFPDSEVQEILDSQFISHEAFDMIKQGKIVDFLYCRAVLMQSFAESLASNHMVYT
jgi:hypothetical protein